MLLSDDIARLRCELVAQLAAPGAELERPAVPRSLLDGCDVLPGLVIAGTVPTVQRVENPDVGRTRLVEHLLHVRDAAVGFGDSLQPVPHLAALGDEVVVRVDHHKSRDARRQGHGAILLSASSGGYGIASRSGTTGVAASPTTKAVRWPTSVNVGRSAALPASAATPATWLRDLQYGRR